MAEMTAVLLVYGTRYALGRRSGAAQDMERAIASSMHVLQHDRATVRALVRDIAECENYGDLCDRESWMRTLGRLNAITYGDAT